MKFSPLSQAAKSNQADCLAASINILYRTLAGVFLESDLGRRFSNGSHSIRISTIYFAAASIPTSIQASATGIRRFRKSGQVLADTLEYRDQVRPLLLESFEAMARSSSSDVMAQAGAFFRWSWSMSSCIKKLCCTCCSRCRLEKKRRPRRFSRYSFQRAPRGRESIRSPRARRAWAQNSTSAFGWDNELGDTRRCRRLHDRFAAGHQWRILRVR